MPRPQTDNREPATQAQYIDLEVIRDADGLVAVISQRRSNGTITFGFFREFERDGEVVKTPFFAEKYVAGFIALSKLTFERVNQIKNTPGELAKLQEKAGFKPTARNGQHHGAGRHGARQ